MSIKIEERIYFDLTDDQLVDKIKDVAKLDEQIVKLNTEIDNLKRKYASEIKSTAAKSASLMQEIRSEQESRIIECDGELDGDMLVLTFEGEEVKKRVASPDEISMFQKNLFDE